MNTRANERHGMDEQDQVHGQSIEPGEIVYDSDRRPVGRVSGFTDGGFEAEAMDPDGSDVEELPGQEFGEGYLMWRCAECGAMDELDGGLPGSCPDCGAPREAISVVEED
ncbi:hypothetical protein ACAH01_16055 (plasmid) [Halomicrobium sp. HM KBTZ05]|uniref:DUF7130 family rubredoxin-like protein n=1 Tax=Halomicrobium sp. HM KBTZ05 TaxID=3242663 RepID=UPI0035583A99